MKETLNHISPSFCAAKWLQVTIDLLHGTTHSCHHPARHEIPLTELKNNPSALHNTNFKKYTRNQMLSGVRPKECEYCWLIEDLSSDMLSDRYLKSLDTWSLPHLARLSNMPWDSDVNPTYLEVMFDKTCNLACAYCFAEVSSSIEKEMNEFGPYPVSNSGHRLVSSNRKFENANPFINAFWKWLPEIFLGLRFFRITGGEPFLSPSTRTVVNFLKRNPNNDLVFSINSNLSLPQKLINEFALLSDELLKNNHIREFELYASVDTYGAQAEYIRFGLNYDIFLKNINSFLKISPKTKLVLMVTFNILSIENFQELLADVLQLKKEYSSVLIDMSYLKDPGYLRANIATEDLVLKLVEIEKFIEENRSDDFEDGFSDYEIRKMFRVFEWIRKGTSEREERVNRSDFFSFIKEYDKRKSTSFSSTFNSMNDFHKACSYAKMTLLDEVNKIS